MKRCTVRWDLFLWLVGKKRGINWENGMMCNGSKSRLPPARHTPGRRFRLHSWMRDRCRGCLRGMRRRYRCEKAGQTMRGRMDSANKQIRPADHFDQKSGPDQNNRRFWTHRVFCSVCGGRILLKRLILINGTMGVGKTAVCRVLEKSWRPVPF